MNFAGLIEPSFADVIRAIENATDLKPQTKAHWCCSLRQIAIALDKPLELIPARWTAIWPLVKALHHARVRSTDLQPRVSSVTAYGYIYKLRRGAELIEPALDFRWLTEIEKDLALVMVAQSKFDRFVLTDRAVVAGLTLIVEAQLHAADEVARAVGIRNGLMLVLIALYPYRRKNFAALALCETLRQIKTAWWITFPRKATKSRRADERRIHDWLVPYLNVYLTEARPVLLKTSGQNTNALWVSSNGQPMTPNQTGKLISRITLQVLGVSISPHIFRTGGATTAATYAPEMPHLASALLDHTEPTVTEQYYIRTTSIAAATTFGRMIRVRQRLCVPKS